MSTERFTTNEAAARLGVTPARVRQMVVSGEIESERFGRDTVITAAALAEAMKRKTKPGPTPKVKVAATNGQATPKKRAAKKGGKK